MKIFPRYPAGQTLIILLFAILALTAPFYRNIAAARPAVSTHQSSAPRSGDFDGPAELPRVHVETSLRSTPASGKILTVHTGEDPSQALSQAACGDTIQLQAGGTFGNLVLPEKKCDDSHWIVVRTSAPDSKLPPEGTRLTPCYAGVSSLPGRPPFQCSSTENVLAKIEFNGRVGPGPVVFARGANHYRLIGLEVTRTSSAKTVYNLIGSNRDAADHIVLDRMWVHGTAHDETVRGLMLSYLQYVAVVDSYFSDFHCVAKTGTCTDSQAIAGGLGDAAMGPYKIENNFLEAAAETVLMGGGESIQTPTDIEIRRNHMFKPMTWMQGQAGFVGGADGNPFIVKNLFELKNAQRVLLEDNILENTWGGFTQAGFAILLTPKNQAGKTGNVCPSCLVTDITIRNCRISHVASGLVLGNGIAGNSGTAKDGGRYSIHDIVLDDMQAELYNGSGAFAQISTTPGVSESPRLHDVSIDHVTAFPPRAVFIIGGPRDNPRMSGLSITNSVFFAVGTQPVVSTGGGREKNCAAMPQRRGGESVLRDCFTTYSFHHNVIIGGWGWPKDNETPKNPAEVGFVNYNGGNGGDYRLSANSRFKHKATDGRDVGADLDAVERATAGVQ